MASPFSLFANAYQNSPIAQSASGTQGATPIDALLQGAAAMQQPGPPVSPSSVYTPEMLQAAINNLQNFGTGLESLYGTPSGAPGASVTQASKIPGRGRKQQAYEQYLIGKGVDPATASRKAAKLKFKDDKGFKKAVREGQFDEFGLSVQGGRVKADQRFTPGAVNVDPQSTALTSAMRGFGLDAIGGARGMLNQGFNADGLSPGQAESLDALKARYMDEFSDVARDSNRAAFGELAGTNTIRSSFAPGFIADTAGKTQSRFLTQAMGELAGREESMLQGRSNRQTQAYNNYLRGILNPGGAGLFTDPQAATAAANLQQQNIANRFGQQGAMTNLMTQPVSLFPDTSEGFFDKASGALSGAAGGAATGAMFGPAGAAIGGALGGLKGLF